MSVPVSRHGKAQVSRLREMESEQNNRCTSTTKRQEISPRIPADQKTVQSHRRRAAGVDAFARSVRLSMVEVENKSNPTKSSSTNVGTLRAIASVAPSTLLSAPVARLQMGSTGPQVAQLQEALAALGYPTGPIDGKFGPITEAALKSFQRDRGIVIDGDYGPQTQSALRTALSPYDFATQNLVSTEPPSRPNATSPGTTQPPANGVGMAPSLVSPEVSTALPVGTDPRIAGMLDWAKSKQGAPYAAVNPFRFGEPPWDGGTHTSVNGSGTSWTYPAGTQVFDCSGFIVAAYRQLGVDLAAKGIASSSTMRSDTSFLQNIPQSELKPGDMVTYSPNDKGIGHVVLFLGEGKCIESSGSAGVVIRDVDWQRADGFKRVPLPDA